MTEKTTKPRAARRSDGPAPQPAVTPPAAALSRLDQLTALLTREDRAAITELTAATGWQPHSVRGAIAGALRQRGLVITSEKQDGIRRYRASRPA